MTKLAGSVGQRRFADGEGSPHALIPCMPSLWTVTATCAGAGRQHGRPPHSNDYVCWRALTTVLGSSEAWAVTAPLPASTRPLPWRWTRGGRLSVRESGRLVLRGVAGATSESFPALYGEQALLTRNILEPGFKEVLRQRHRRGCAIVSERIWQIGPASGGGVAGAAPAPGDPSYHERLARHLA